MPREYSHINTMKKKKSPKVINKSIGIHEKMEPNYLHLYSNYS